MINLYTMRFRVLCLALNNTIRRQSECYAKLNPGIKANCRIYCLLSARFGCLLLPLPLAEVEKEDAAEENAENQSECFNKELLVLVLVLRRRLSF